MEPIIRPVVSYSAGGCTTEDPRALSLTPPIGEDRVAILLPTYLGRCSATALFKTLGPLAVSMAVARRELPRYEFIVVVVMQWEPPETQQSCHERLAQLEQTWCSDFNAAFVGVALSPKSKLLALNSCRPLIHAAGAAVVGWIDDDVVLQERCLVELMSAFDPTFQGIYGARKITVPDDSRFSRWWAGRKNRIEPLNRYPHGCCMLMSKAEFCPGIPLAHQTDDHHFLLRLIQAEAADPLWRLRVVPEARLDCPTANSPGITLRRLRRNYTNVLRVLVDAPSPTVHFFLRHLMFPNLRPPRELREIWSATYWSGLFWHFLKLLFWLSCALPVLARGALNRPRIPRWYSAPFPTMLSSRDDD